MSGTSNGIGMTSERTRARMIERLRAGGIGDETVLAAMDAIPRHIFVEEALSSRAYEDTPLPIGFGQTISSPYIVARMTELLRAGGRLGRVLEVGSGCGYQTAVLARLAAEVYSVERIAALLAKARLHLKKLRVGNVRFKHADGGLGLSEAAPFDAIIVTAATPAVPTTLASQLVPGGRLVYPKGAAEQRLCVLENTPGGFMETVLEEVRFVPLKSDLA
jgi:protein-L-isoaspartate(D-aspartate) O-methyltransferase